MKKLLIMLLVVCMPFTALAQEAEVTANAVAESRNVMQITAPFSGVLKPFEWELGDVMEEGVTLFELETQKVYAPADGTVRAVFAQAGELAEDVQAQYGMVLSLEKDNCLVVNATTTGAYNDPDNPTFRSFVVTAYKTLVKPAQTEKACARTADCTDFNLLSSMHSPSADACACVNLLVCRPACSVMRSYRSGKDTISTLMLLSLLKTLPFVHIVHQIFRLINQTT